MALRLIEIILPNQDSGKVQELLKDQEIVECRQVPISDGEAFVRIVLNAEKSEPILDLLEKNVADGAGRIVVLPVAATLPHIQEPPPPAPTEEQKPPMRIAREELYEELKDAALCSKIFMVMTVLAIIVAVVGIYLGLESIVIGAMVISPSIGPSIALALGTTLGDLFLLRRALLTSICWILMTAALSAIVGLIVHVNPELPYISLHTKIGLADIAIALASGCAGCLAFTTIVSSALVGVVIAVSLLPPLVIFGLLLGSGFYLDAVGSLSLFLMNFICINLAAVLTFIFQGIHPLNWWEKSRAKKATKISIGIWAALLLILIGLILVFK